MMEAGKMPPELIDAMIAERDRLRMERNQGATMKVPIVDGIDAAFGQGAMKILPPMSEIPDEFKSFNRPNKWTQCVDDWFYHGIKNCKWTPKAGVNTVDALRAVKCCINSFDPAHEHKTAGCAYLLSQWFESVTYDKAKP